MYIGDLYLSPDTENLDPVFLFWLDVRRCLANKCATEPEIMYKALKSSLRWYCGIM